jgi:hypothetical protein
MDSSSSSELFEKGKWRDITPGKIPVLTTFYQKPKTGKRKGQVIKTTRPQWVIPSNALSGDYEIDFDKMGTEGVSFPNPDSSDRLHSHYGAEEHHKVGFKHKDIETAAEHRDEMEKYERDFYKVNQKQTEWERLHRSGTRKLKQEKERLDTKKKKSTVDKLKIDKLGEEIQENEKALTEVVGKETPSWLERYNVQIRPEATVAFRGTKVKADIYYIPEAERSVYIFEDMMGKHYLYTKGLGVEKYSKSSSVYKRLEDIFSDREMRIELQLSSKALEKKREEEVIREKEENREKLTSLVERSKQLEARVAKREAAKKKAIAEKKKLRAERKKAREEEALARIERKRKRLLNKRKKAKELKAARAERLQRREERQKKTLSEKRKKAYLKKLKSEAREAFQVQQPGKKRRSKNTMSKKSLINKMDTFMKSWEHEDQITEDAAPKTAKFELYSEFKSGEDSVKLEGDGNQYKVSTNEVPSATTSNLQEAMSKYYSSVSKIINAKNEDKDMGLEIFGDHVLQTARNTRKLMSALDKMIEVKMIENLDYSQISLPFNSDFILKYEPQSDVFETVPLPQDSESVEAPSEAGGKIGRKDLKKEEYKNNKVDDKNNEVIEEGTQRGPNLGATGQNLISNSLNQPQIVPARQEEAKRAEVIENPAKVDPTYQQTLKVPENKPIEQG